MKINFVKKLLSLLIIITAIFVARFVFAQDFGTAEVNSGLSGSLAAGDPRVIVGRIINIALGFLGIIALGLIIYAGFLWMTSSGNEEKVASAKKILINASIGLIIILSSWAIATFVINKLGDATGGTGGNGVCYDGQISSCGCGGSMACFDGAWGGCIGSDCGGGPGPSSCDSSPSSGCQAANAICSIDDYCDVNCICQPRGGVGDSCDADLENSTCDVNHESCDEFLSCDSDTCTCFGPPVITGVSPMGGFCEENRNKSCSEDLDCDTTCNQITPNGATDNFITIYGKNFGEYSVAGSKIIFGSNSSPQDGRNPAEVNSVCVNFWQDDQIIIAVPIGAVSGPIKVVSIDGSEDTTDNEYGPQIPDFVSNNIVRPGLCLISPNSGELSSSISYQGINLYSGEAYFGNYQSSVLGLDSNFTHPSGLSGVAATPNIRSGESGSFVINNINGNQEKSNYLRFVKEANPNDGPFIVSFSPNQGVTGQYVTIIGSGFGGAKGESNVYFGNVEADYDFPAVCANSFWSDNQVIVKVPEGISNGNYLIRMVLGENSIDTQESNPNIFRVDDSLSLKTSLCKLEPKQGAASTPVRAYGEYFGQLGREALVEFSISKNVYGEVEEENGANVVLVEVPGGAVTGPVKIVKNNEWGNELNFEVKACSSDLECPDQVCCPINTYKKGRCVSTLSECFLDIPTSVFEWNFSTGFTNNEKNTTESCETLSDYFGACQVGAFCPNVPGLCSPYAGGEKRKVAECDFSCVSISGCGGLGSSTCTYNSTINKCVKNGLAGNCSLPKTQSFDLDEISYEFNLTCNSDRKWEIQTDTSCPTGWVREFGNICVDETSVCDICEESLSCEKIGSSGVCVSNIICPVGAICEDNPDILQADSCIILDKSSCDCCCRIENSTQDCCAPLECLGTCGEDTSDDGVGFGSCSGCANVGTTTAEHDAACNCFGGGGQYCSITPDSPSGVCSDCSGLQTLDTCADHSGTCCFDSNRTLSFDDDSCRGGLGSEISSDPENPDFGYCGYYNCFSTSTPPIGEPTECASSTPVKIGIYKDLYACTDGCASDPDKDFCSLFDGQKDECASTSDCCFDEATSLCKSGTKITEGVDIGYCAYYNCESLATMPPGDPSLCDAIPRTSGDFDNQITCANRCGGNEGGAGKDCVSPAAVSVCNFGVCNFPGMACLAESGDVAIDASDCGTCCCSPVNPSACKIEEAPNLYCQPDKGNCTGDDRGLCCGCEKDGDCGNVGLVGCGIDTCCQARPEVIESLPESGDINICRNAVLKVSFDQPMDIASFNANVVLMEEMNYGGGVCPAGTFVYENNNIAKTYNSWLEKTISKMHTSFSRLFNIFNKQVLADLPDPNKLYCAFPGDTTGEQSGSQATMYFSPRRLLAPNAKYFLIIKGDEDLNSQSGVISADGIGLNGLGIDQSGSFIEGETISFNDKSYNNSHIIQFRTLSDKDPNSGICAIDQIKLFPSSYLFKTTSNGLNEDDNDSNNKSFDTEYDRDKVFSAWAYSLDDQIIQPVTGYFWDWKFELKDPSVVAMSSITGLESNKVIISAIEGITDGESELSAIINMDRFLNSSSSVDPNCSCMDDVCSSNCRNAFSIGDSMFGQSSLYVFICNNPWPPINTDGTWEPWRDNCDNAIGDCNDFNYKFYYCRDAGEPGTFDDLPAIINQAVIRGQGATLVCSSDSSSCSALNASCGDDRNGDGSPDGICIWNVLKESYFFHEEVLSAGEITQVLDRKTGGEIIVNWKSVSTQVDSYKIYYGESGKAITSFKEAQKEIACALVGSEYICSAIIPNLDNNKSYSFRLSVISVNETESALSSEARAIPTDQTAPVTPQGLIIEDKDEVVKFAWTLNTDDALFYRLYRGILSGVYGESFDSGDKAYSLSLEKTKLSSGNNYFSISAVDSYENESAKTAEVIFFK